MLLLIAQKFKTSLLTTFVVRHGSSVKHRTVQSDCVHWWSRLKCTGQKLINCHGIAASV